MKLCAQKGVNPLLAQVIKPSSEENQNMIQMKSLFHVLTYGHPMLKYESLYELFVGKGIPNNLKTWLVWFSQLGFYIISMHVQV